MIIKIILILFVFLSGCSTSTLYATKEDLEKVKKESLERDAVIVQHFNNFIEIYNNHIRDLHGFRFKTKITNDK